MKWSLHVVVVCAQRLILSHLFWLPAFLQQLLKRNTNTGRSVADWGRCFLMSQHWITTQAEHVALSRDVANSCVKRFDKGSKVNTFIELEALGAFSEAMNYWMCKWWLIFFSFLFLLELTCIRILCPSSDSSRSSSMSISNSGISSS